MVPISPGRGGWGTKSDRTQRGRECSEPTVQGDLLEEVRVKGSLPE